MKIRKSKETRKQERELRKAVKEAGGLKKYFKNMREDVNK